MQQTNGIIYSSEKKVNKSTIILMFLCIYLSDALLFTYNSNTFFSTTISQVGLVVLAILFFILNIWSKKGKINLRFALMLIICGLLLLESIIHDEIRGGYISKIALFILGFCMFDLYNSEELIVSYKICMIYICAASLFGFIFGRFLTNVSFLPSIISMTGRRYIFLLLTNVSVLDLNRNYGPFTEPARFQAFICLALILELFDQNNEKVNWKRVSLFLITIVSTFSATAFISCAFIMVAYITSNQAALKIGKRIILIVVIVLTVILLVYYSDGMNMVITKFQMGEKSDSFVVRTNSIIGALSVALKYPIFGTGFGKYNYEFQNALSLSNSQVSTNTILIYFAKFGIFIGIYYVLNAYMMLRSITKRYTAIILFVGYFFTTSGISLVDSIIFTSIIFYRKSIMEKSFGS